jgi:hypothetical protein
MFLQSFGTVDVVPASTFCPGRKTCYRLQKYPLMDTSAFPPKKTALPMTMLNLTDVHVAHAVCLVLPAGAACCLLVVLPPQKEQKTYHSAV